MTKAQTEQVLDQLASTMTVLSEQVSQNTQDIKEAFPDFHTLQRRISDLEERVTSLEQRTIIMQPFNSTRFR